MAKLDKISIYVPVFISFLLYLFMGYFVERHEGFILLIAFFLLFLCYGWIIKYSQNQNINKLLLFSIAARLLLVLSFPVLSDDIYRFFWDGKLLVNGINPFSMVPSEWVAGQILPAGLSFELFQQLNSPAYYTIYPPVAQGVFWLAALLSDNVIGAVVLIRLFILFTEVGTFYFILKLLSHFKLPTYLVLLYAFNPLVILELTGNLHFEAFMIFFLAGGIYFFLKNEWILSIILWALAIASKLIPLVFLPLLIVRLWGRKNMKVLLQWVTGLGVVIVILFLPLLSQDLINGMQDSVSLYFQKFEFNASIYYLIREIGYWVKGYNIIQSLGPWLAVITLAAVIIWSGLSKKLKLPEAMLWTLFVYLLMATTVHPWYITSLVALSVFTRYRFPILWSFLIFFTYLGYNTDGYVENYWIVAIEYCVVFLFMMYEIFYKKEDQKNQSHTLQYADIPTN